MAPHTAALVAVAYYVRNGGDAYKFTVEVSGKRTQTYTIEKSGTKYNCSKAGDRWSCDAHMYISGNKITIGPHEHHPPTKLRNEFYINGKEIERGEIVGSNQPERNGTFKGMYEKNGKIAKIDSDPAGRTYTAEIKSPEIK